MQVPGKKPETREKVPDMQHVPFGVALKLRPVLDLSPDQVLKLSALNKDLRLEMDSEGDLMVMNSRGGLAGET